MADSATWRYKAVSKTQEYLFDIADLVTLPDIYIAVKEAVEDPDVGINDLAEVITYDPAISTRLLKVANSPFYGQISNIDTVKKAISLLGTKTVHDLVLATSIAHAFQSIVGINYDVATFWQNSLMRATVAKVCAHELKIREPDRFFILGLLSDIGHMVMSIRAPKLMLKVLQQHNKTGYPLYLFERSTFGFDYGELGADVLESWSLPESIVNAIRYQNCPEISPEYQQEAAIIYCAGRLHPGESTFPSMLDIETMNQVNIGQFDYDQVRSMATALYEEALNLFPVNQLKQAI